MASEEYRIATERTETGYQHRYGCMREENIDRFHPNDRNEIETMHMKILNKNQRLKLITSEVRLN